MAKRQRSDLEARWRRIIQRHEGSGLGVKTFCQREGITQSAFYYWRKTIRSRDLVRHKAERSNRLVPAVLKPTLQSGVSPHLVDGERDSVKHEVEMRLPGGLVIIVRTPHALPSETT